MFAEFEPSLGPFTALVLPLHISTVSWRALGDILQELLVRYSNEDRIRHTSAARNEANGVFLSMK
jgi:hypothetical protein